MQDLLAKTNTHVTSLPRIAIEPAVRMALLEDLGAGDLTTAACIAPESQAEATFYAKAPGVLAGQDIAALVFALVDSSVVYRIVQPDGFRTPATKTPIATATGPAQALLMGERVALNFLQHMSGIATLTAQYAALTEGTSARVVDTRKTTPGLRVFEKYAVRVGGGWNHRMGLYDAVMIKDNHIKAAGGIGPAVAAARRTVGHTVAVEVEASNLQQVEEALAAGADIIMLDNMSTDAMAEAVAHIAGRAVCEASGGITMERIPEIAAAGVDVISVGALTHSAPSLDISLDFAE